MRKAPLLGRQGFLRSTPKTERQTPSTLVLPFQHTLLPSFSAPLTHRPFFSHAPKAEVYQWSTDAPWRSPAPGGFHYVPLRLWARLWRTCYSQCLSFGPKLRFQSLAKVDE